MPQNKVSRPKREIKTSRKKPLKTRNNGKKQTWQPLINQTGKQWKKLFWNKEKHGWNRGISHIAIYVHLYKRKFLLSVPGYFFPGTSLSLSLDTRDTPGSVFLISVFFQHWNKAKAMNFTKHRRKTSLLHTLSHKCLKSFGFIISL